MSLFRAGVSYLVIMPVFILLLSAQTKTERPATPSSPGTISASGCVEGGVEAGCLVLRETETKTLYNLLFAGKKPVIGTVIHFTGKKHDGPTTCMQGEPVHVEEWSVIKMECSRP